MTDELQYTWPEDPWLLLHEQETFHDAAAVSRAFSLLEMKPAFFPPIIDSTIICDWRACKQSCFRKYFQRLGSASIDPDLHFGGCYASGLDTLRKSFYLHGLSSAEALSRACTVITKQWGDYVPPETKTGPHIKQWGRCLDALDSYLRQYPFDLDNVKPHKHGDIPSIEYSFTSHILNPVSGEPFRHPQTADPLLHSGRIDMIGEAPGPTICPLDDKTAGREWQINWRLRNQFLGYTDQLLSQNIRTDIFLVRRAIILKNEIKHIQEMVPMPTHMLDRYREMRANTISEMLQHWKFFLHLLLSGDEEPWRAFDLNLSDACNAYKGCMLQHMCCARFPAQHEASFPHNSWSPLHVSSEN